MLRNMALIETRLWILKVVRPCCGNAGGEGGRGEAVHVGVRFPALDY